MNSSAEVLGDESSSQPALLPVYTHIQYPFALERGEGVFVYDDLGRRYIDFYGGHCVSSVGHCHPEVTQAIAKQAGELTFYSNLAPLAIRERAASRLLRFAKNDFHSVFFCNSGAEANENALKIAIKATGRSKVIGFNGGFHGRTLLALGATDNKGWHQTFSHWVGPVDRLAANVEADLAKIDQETAAVILEPIQSIGGVTVFERDYLQKLREVCTAQGAMLIFDEVQTGVGRTGVPFVSGHWGVLPDMMTLAKGLASGFAIGAVVMTEAVARTITAGDVAATFGGGPMAMAAMIATLDVIDSEGLVLHATTIERYVREKFAEPWVKEVRGRGCLLGLVLDQPAKPIQKALFEKGLITGLNSNPNLVHLLPPLTINTEHVDLLHSALRQVAHR